MSTKFRCCGRFSSCSPTNKSKREINELLSDSKIDIRGAKLERGNLKYFNYFGNSLLDANLCGPLNNSELCKVSRRIPQSQK